MEFIVERLQSEGLRHAEHGEIEQMLHFDGMELLRRLLQGHLDRVRLYFDDAITVLRCHWESVFCIVRQMITFQRTFFVVNPVFIEITT